MTFSSEVIIGTIPLKSKLPAAIRRSRTYEKLAASYEDLPRTVEVKPRPRSKSVSVSQAGNVQAAGSGTMNQTAGSTNQIQCEGAGTMNWGACYEEACASGKRPLTRLTFVPGDSGARVGKVAPRSMSENVLCEVKPASRAMGRSRTVSEVQGTRGVLVEEAQGRRGVPVEEAQRTRGVPVEEVQGTRGVLVEEALGEVVEDAKGTTRSISPGLYDRYSYRRNSAPSELLPNNDGLGEKQVGDDEREGISEEEAKEGQQNGYIKLAPQARRDTTLEQGS